MVHNASSVHAIGSPQTKRASKQTAMTGGRASQHATTTKPHQITIFEYANNVGVALLPKNLR